MLLGKVGVALGKEEGVISDIVGVFRQRLFHPVSCLDGPIVTELGKMAAELGDSQIHEVHIMIILYLYCMYLQLTFIFLANLLKHTCSFRKYPCTFLLLCGANDLY